MEEVGLSTTSGDSNETVLLEMSQVFIQQLNESKDREIKLQEKIRILEKQLDIQNGPAVPNQQQHHGAQELRQQIAELTQQFRQLKSISDEKVQRLSNEVARLETEAKDKDAKIKDMADRENAHQSTINDVRTTTSMDELRNSFADGDQASERGPSERRLPRGFNGRKVYNDDAHDDDAHDDDEQTTPMDELRNSFTTNAQTVLNPMDQMVQPIRGGENSSERPCLQPPGARARRALAVNISPDVVSRHEEPAEDLQKKFDELVSKSKKRLDHIRLLEHKNDELHQQLDEANAQLDRMRAESEAHDQQLASRSNQECERLNTATQKLKTQLEKANEENERLKQSLDVNEHRLANTQRSLMEAEERIRETGTEDVERKLREYEENRVELNRRKREIDGLKTANEFFENERERAASHFQQEKSTYEAQIAELQRTVSRATEDAKREQRKLQDEIVALKERGKQVERCANADAAALESVRKEVKNLKGEQLTMVALLIEGDQEIVQLREDLRRVNKISRDSGNMSSPTAIDTAAVEVGRPVIEYPSNEPRHESGGSSQHAEVRVAQEKGANSSCASAMQDHICTMCNCFLVNAYIRPCEHVVGCDKCLNEMVKQKEKCPKCHKRIETWEYILLG